MASAYSSLKIELIGTGEQSGTWGTTTNTNLGTALEEAITGRATANFTTDADLTLGYSDSNATQTFRNLILNVTSVSLSTTRNLIVPTIEKQYLVENNTTGGQSIVIKTAAGTGITIPNGKKAHVYADGTNVVQASDFFPTIDINGGTIDGATIGASSAGAATFTNLTASGTVNFSGATVSNGGTVTTVDINGGTIDGTTIGGSTPAAGTFTTATATTGNITTVNATTVNTTTLDLTNLEVTNIKAKDGTAAATIADSTGKITVSTELAVDNLNLSGNALTSTNANGNIDLTPNGTGEVNIAKVDIDSGAIDGTTIGANSAAAGTFTNLTATTGVNFSGATVSNGGSVTTVDINGGTIDGTAIGGATPAAGAFTTLSASSTATLNTLVSSGATITGGTINNTAIGGSTPAAGTFTTATATTGNITTVNATTVDATNVEVTNIKAKDGTAAVTIADSTGVVTVSTQLNVDNVNVSGNTISTTDTDGNLILSPNGNGVVQEEVGGTNYNIASQYDIGTAPNEIPLNQYLGDLAYQDAVAVNIDGGTIDNTAIGGATPAAGAFTTLSASSTATFAAGAVGTPSITTAGDTNTGIFFPAADTIAFAEGGAEAMRITSSGNVGIGTSSPGSALSVIKGAAGDEVACFQNSGSFGIRIIPQIGGSGAVTAIRTGAGESITLDTSNTERMRIDSSGNLLVGTTTSKAKTTIVGASVVGDYYSFGTTLNQLENFEICRFSLSRSGNSGVNAFSGTLNFNVSLFRGTSVNNQNNVSVLAHVFLGGFPTSSSSTELSADIQLISTATNQPEGTPGSITIALVAEGSNDGGVSWTTLTNNNGVPASSATGILIRIRANLTGTTPSSFNGTFKCFSSISGACNDNIVLSSTTISII